MMMSLGMFVFSLPTLAYQELQRRTSWKHTSSPRVGARDASQYVGQGPDTISLSGQLLPQLVGDFASLSTLRSMGDEGESWPLVTGLGEVIGLFVIENLEVRQQEFFEDGAARQTDFTLDLRLVEDPPAQSTSAGGGGTSGTTLA